MNRFVVAVGRCRLLWITVDFFHRCGSFRLVVDCCRLLWIFVGCCGVVPSFSKYGSLSISRFLPKLMKMIDYHYVKSVGIRSFSGPNSGKYGPEKIRIRTLFTQCIVRSLLLQ